MPLKNYTTKVSADRSIAEIQGSLVKHGATGILLEYEKGGTGRIAALKFKITIRENDVAFRLPVSWKKFQDVLIMQGVKRAGDDDYVYRVTWRNVRDWVLAQMALLETEMVDLPQIFLPYAMASDGVNTLYDRVLKSDLLLPGGNA